MARAMARLFSWFSRLRLADEGASSVPLGLAVYAIGDVHGRFDLLTSLMAQIRLDADQHSDDRERLIVFLGDYIDRGLDSRQVIDSMVAGEPQGFRVVHLLGNHEQAMLEFLDGQSIGADWLTYGGLETLYSYGVQLKGMPNTAAAVSELRDALRKAVPADHLHFMRRCILTHSEGDYLFVHAGVRPGVRLDHQSPIDLLWIRDEFLESRSRFEGRVVVHGHTISDKPQNRPHRINVDTGAFASGRLTSLVLRGATRRFLTTGTPIGTRAAT